MGLQRQPHFFVTKAHRAHGEASVRDIVNVTAVAVIDAIVEKKKKEQK